MCGCLFLDGKSQNKSKKCFQSLMWTRNGELTGSAALKAAEGLLRKESMEVALSAVLVSNDSPRKSANGRG